MRSASVCNSNAGVASRYFDEACPPGDCSVASSSSFAFREARVTMEPVNPIPASNWSSTLPPLPDELWTKIFDHALPDNPTLSLKEPPALVTHVCRTWRRIAIAYSLLWKRISLPSFHDDLSRRTVELFRLWLQRSKGCPLEIDLRLPFDTLPWAIATNVKEYQLINAILSLLHEHASRLRTLLRGYPQILHKVLQAEDLPLLELFIVDPPQGGLRTFSLNVLPSNLKCFAAFNTYIHFTRTIRWPDLEHLELWQTDDGFAGFSARNCLDILSQLPSLRAVGFHICVDDDESRNNFPTKVVLPSLRCLVISTFTERNISLLFSTLSTPALEAVGLDGCNRRIIADNIPGFFRQCSQTLKLAAFGQVGVIDVTLIGALTWAPSRCRVVICSSSFDGHVAARLSHARRTEGGIRYADRWSSKGSPGHLLSLAYTSEEMWSHMEERNASFRFPCWTHRDLNQWRPAAVASDEYAGDEGAGSIHISICKGQSVSHTCFSGAWLS